VACIAARQVLELGKPISWNVAQFFSLRNELDSNHLAETQIRVGSMVARSAEQKINPE
jgi:hypothetical protein